MITNASILVVFVISFLISYLSTPIARVAAFKFKILDQPNNKKVHGRPIPLLGGVAIYTAFFLSLLFTVNLTKQVVGLFIGSTILLVTGIIDDRRGMLPSVKLLAQLLAALIVTRLGIKTIFLPDHYLNLFVTCFWIVGITNAFNLLDNLNGLSAGLACIAAAFLCILGLQSGQTDLLILAIALSGACLGFLRYNFPRASIFMGDAGSMFLGFILSSIAILGRWETTVLPFSLSIPILILAYPIFDTALVVISRVLNKKSIYIGGKDHSSHRLAIIGLKRRKAVLFIYIISFFLGLSGVLMSKVDFTTGIIVLTSVFLCLFILGLRLGFVNIYRNKSTEKRMNFIDVDTRIKFIKILDRIQKYSLYLILVFLPISKALLEISVSFAIGSWIIKKLLKREYKIRYTPLNKPIFIFFIVSTFSLINTNFVGESLEALFFKLGEYILLFFVVVETIDTRKKLKNIFIVLSIISILVGMSAVLQPITHFDFLRWRPSLVESKVAGPFGMPNELAGWTVSLLPVWLSLFLYNFKNRSLKLFMVYLMILLTAVLFLSGVRGAYLAFIGSLIFLIVFTRRKIPLLLIMMVLVFPLISNNFLIDYLSKEPSFLERVLWWRTSLRMINAHPIVGVGINTFCSAYQEYHVGGNPSPAYVHNCYLQIMAETGLLGLLSFLWMMVVLFYIGIKKYMENKNKFYGSALLGLLAGVFAFLLHSFIDTNLYSLQLLILLWFVMGIITTMSMMFKKRKEVSWKHIV